MCSRRLLFFSQSKGFKDDLPLNKEMDKNGSRRKGSVFMWPRASFASPPLSFVLTRDHLEWDGVTRGGLLKCCLALLCFSLSLSTYFFPSPFILFSKVAFSPWRISHGYAYLWLWTVVLMRDHTHTQRTHKLSHFF